jgi:hypothetical protein
MLPLELSILRGKLQQNSFYDIGHEDEKQLGTGLLYVEEKSRHH